MLRALRLLSLDPLVPLEQRQLLPDLQVLEDPPDPLVQQVQLQVLRDPLVQRQQ